MFLTPFEIAAAMLLVPALIGLAILQVAHRRWVRAQRDIHGR